MKGVYQITNKTNGKKYIGSSEDIKKRWRDHKHGLNGGYHKNPHLQNAWNKNGKDAFTFEMLEETSNTLEREQWYLDNAIDWKRDYNITRYARGGGQPCSEETKRKLSEALTGRTLSEERKRNISEALTGRTRSEETKRKISETQKGKVISEETKRKLSEAHKGKTLSEETKRKISETLTGRKHSEETIRKMRGRKHTEEAKRKMRGRKLSEETKRKISETLTGRTLSEETKRKMSEAQLGENGSSAKLTAEQVWEIHTLYATGKFSQEQLSKRFPTGQTNIGYIVRGESWPHVYKKFHGRNHEREK